VARGAREARVAREADEVCEARVAREADEVCEARVAREADEVCEAREAREGRLIHSLLTQGKARKALKARRSADFTLQRHHLLVGPLGRPLEHSLVCKTNCSSKVLNVTSANVKPTAANQL
jgi:hypothetical protein